ncbi:hypothetical protein BST61_g27 [Cercospora zeina]
MSATTAMPTAHSDTNHTSFQDLQPKRSSPSSNKSIPSGPATVSTPADPSATTINAIRLRNLQHSPLLRLPRELRDIITSYTLTTSLPPHHSSHHQHHQHHHHHHHHHHITSSSPSSSSSKPRLPPLLQTCTLLRPECAELYYSTQLLLAGGAPSPQYEKAFFRGFDPLHKKFVRRCHWLRDSYGTREQAMVRAGELDALTGTREGVWTVGFIDCFGGEGWEVGKSGRGRGRAVYVNCWGVVREAGRV